MKKRMIALVLAAAMAVSAAGCGGVNGSEVVAEVGDAKITADVANFYARYQQAQYETYMAAYMGDDMWASEIEEGTTYEDSVKESILDSLENLYLLDAHKDEYGVSVTEEEEEAIQKAAAEFADTNEKDSKNVVSGDTATVAEVLRLLTVQTKMRTAMVADVDTDVSDEEAAQKSMQYVLFSSTATDEDGNSVQLTDEELEVLKEEAEDFQAGAAGAEDFEAYAQEMGYTATTKTFDAETTSPSQLLIEAADVLEEGQVTEVIEDTAGYYVAKVTSLLDRTATDQEKESIISERKSERYSELCDQWKEEAGVTVNSKVWAKISFVKQGVTIKDTASETEEESTGDAEDAGDTEDTGDAEDAGDAEDTEDTENTEDTADTEE